MRRFLVMLLSVAGYFFLTGCDNPSSPPPLSSVSEYTADTAIVDYSGVNNVVYFDFSTGKKKVIAHNLWHIAFDSDRFVIANSGNYGYGALVCSTGISEIAQDFTSWKDSLDITSNTGHFTLTTLEHNVLGLNYQQDTGIGATYTKNVYIVRTEEGKFFKLQITGELAIGAGLRMRIDSLSGTGAIEDTFATSSTYDYTYVNLNTRSAVTVAPPKDQWDIRFGRTAEYIMNSLTGGRSSIAINTRSGVEVAIIDSAQLANARNTSGLIYSTNLFAIGYNWYSTDRSTGTTVYVVNPSVYVFKTTEGNFAKMKLLSFKGPDNESFWTVFKYHYQSDGATTFSK